MFHKKLLKIANVVNGALLLKKSYKNWSLVLLRCILKQDVIALVRETAFKLEGFDSYDLVRIAKLLSHNWKIQEITQSHIVFISDTELSIKCRRIGTDVGTLAEIFVDIPYSSPFFGNVVDVGMSCGDSSLFFAVNGASKVIGLEPFPESFDLAVENFYRNKVMGLVFPINQALSYKEGDAYLRVSMSDPTENSLQEKSSRKRYALDNCESILKVQTTTIDRLIMNFGLERIDFLKMDCEGCEYEVLNNLSNGTFSRIQEVIIEYHQGIQNLISLFQGNGFEVKSDRGRRGFMHAIRRGKKNIYR